MYGLRNAANLAYENSKRILKPFGYKPIVGTVSLRAHETWRVRFCIYIDDFGVKYHTRDDANHFLHALGAHYKYTCDWTGKHYCGLTIDWRYQEGYLNVSMPGYIDKILKRLDHRSQKVPQLSPHQDVAIRFTPKGSQQFTADPDTTPFFLQPNVVTCSRS